MLNTILGHKLFWFIHTVNNSLNPDTGDRNAYLMKFVVAALILSAVAIVVYLVTSKRKKK